MKLYLFDSEDQLAAAAAKLASERIQQCINVRNKVCLVAATGSSQKLFLKKLTTFPGVDWEKVTVFHLDEYLGIGPEHPASFHKYLQEKLVDIVHPGQMYFIDGDSPDALSECQRLNNLISQYIIDLTFVGIGLNGHLAFNDPPADFQIKEPYIAVNLSENNRQHQVNKGHFPSLTEVPQRAITMSIQQIMKSKEIFCLVMGGHKAEIVAKSLCGEVNSNCPASILQNHPNTVVFLDKKAANLLPAENTQYTVL